MLEEYLKKLEDLIIPQNYNKNNFKEKIRSEFEDPALLEEKNNKKNFTKKSATINTNSSNNQILNIQSSNPEEEKRLIEEYIQKMGVKDILEEKNISSENKLKIYQKILEKNENSSGSLNQPGSKTIENILNNYSSVENNNYNLNKISSITEGTNKSQKNSSVSPSRKIKSNINYEEDNTVREKIHELNVKNMNYRYEVESLKHKIDDLTKRNEDLQCELEKSEKQRENNNRYLIKLESLISNGGNLNLENRNSMGILNFSSQQNQTRNTMSNNQSTNNLKSVNSSKLNTSKLLTNNNNNINVSSTNIMNNTHTNNVKGENIFIDINKSNNLIIEDRSNNTHFNINGKNDLKDFISNLISENQKLKLFQSQVFEISKNYDDINENLIDGMKQIQLMMNINKNEENENERENLGEENQELNKKEIFDNFDKVIENVEKTLEIKQSEYNFLLESKDQEIKFLQDEVIKLNDTCEVVKRDRIRDQKMINDYETEVNMLSNRIKEGKVIHGDNVVVDNTQALRMEKKIAPAKLTVNKIVKKFERTFDLQDKNNVRMLSNIKGSIK